MKRRKESLRLAWVALCLLQLALLVSCMSFGCSTSGSSSTGTRVTPRTTYTTQFPLTENPISESGEWSNGKQNGLDWSNVASHPGLAYGTQSGSSGFDDSTALLTGSWSANQMAEATVHSVNQNDAIYEEVALHLRSSLSAHNATGYEIDFRCSKSAKAYAEIVRWNGALGAFTYLKQQQGAVYGVSDGDVVKVTIVGNVITGYINGAQVIQATDDTYTSGNPGMGFFLNGAATATDFGFTSFSASDI